MEEDLKDIELFIYFCRAPYNFEHESEEKSYKELSDKIEHLIREYKELKEIEQIHRQENGELRKQVKELEEDLTSVYLKGVYDERDKWIALVEEEIEKLKQEGNYKTLKNPNGRVHFQAEPCDYKIQVLQELLEKRK